MLFDFDDILLEPVVLSNISSRKKINPYYNGHLPLMTAPMDTVISKENALLFNQNKIINVLPRHIPKNQEFIQFVSYGLDEFIELYITTKKTIIDHDYVLIDVANGHMDKLYFAAHEAKKQYKDKLILMIGNVANPQTFDQYCRIDVDYIRIGIGNGGGCWEENTLIKTNNGHKKIKDININDLVLTHKGTYEEVINIISFEEEKNLLEINGEICTDNHELYVINKKDVHLVTEKNYTEYAFFIEAKLLDEKQHLILSWEE